MAESPINLNLDVEALFAKALTAPPSPSPSSDLTGPPSPSPSVDDNLSIAGSIDMRSEWKKMVDSVVEAAEQNQNLDTTLTTDTLGTVISYIEGCTSQMVDDISSCLQAFTVLLRSDSNAKFLEENQQEWFTNLKGALDQIMTADEEKANMWEDQRIRFYAARDFNELISTICSNETLHVRTKEKLKATLLPAAQNYVTIDTPNYSPTLRFQAARLMAELIQCHPSKNAPVDIDATRLGATLLYADSFKVETSILGILIVSLLPLQPNKKMSKKKQQQCDTVMDAFIEGITHDEEQQRRLFDLLETVIQSMADDDHKIHLENFIVAVNELPLPEGSSDTHHVTSIRQEFIKIATEEAELPSTQEENKTDKLVLSDTYVHFGRYGFMIQPHLAHQGKRSASLQARFPDGLTIEETYEDVSQLKAGATKRRTTMQFASILNREDDESLGAVMVLQSFPPDFERVKSMIGAKTAESPVDAVAKSPVVEGPEELSQDEPAQSGLKPEDVLDLAENEGEPEPLPMQTILSTPMPTREEEEEQGEPRFESPLEMEVEDMTDHHPALNGVKDSESTTSDHSRSPTPSEIDSIDRASSSPVARTPGPPTEVDMDVDMDGTSTDANEPAEKSVTTTMEVEQAEEQEPTPIKGRKTRGAPPSIPHARTTRSRGAAAAPSQEETAPPPTAKKGRAVPVDKTKDSEEEPKNATSSRTKKAPARSTRSKKGSQAEEEETEEEVETKAEPTRTKKSAPAAESLSQSLSQTDIRRSSKRRASQTEQPPTPPTLPPPEEEPAEAEEEPQDKEEKKPAAAKGKGKGQGKAPPATEKEKAAPAKGTGKGKAKGKGAAADDRAGGPLLGGPGKKRAEIAAEKAAALEQSRSQQEELEKQEKEETKKKQAEEKKKREAEKKKQEQEKKKKQAEEKKKKEEEQEKKRQEEEEAAAQAEKEAAEAEAAKKKAAAAAAKKKEEDKKKKEAVTETDTDVEMGEETEAATKPSTKGKKADAEKEEKQSPTVAAATTTSSSPTRSIPVRVTGTTGADITIKFGDQTLQISSQKDTHVEEEEEQVEEKKVKAPAKKAPSKAVRPTKEDQAKEDLFDAFQHAMRDHEEEEPRRTTRARSKKAATPKTTPSTSTKGKSKATATASRSRAPSGQISPYDVDEEDDTPFDFLKGFRFDMGEQEETRYQQEEEEEEMPLEPITTPRTTATKPKATSSRARGKQVQAPIDFDSMAADETSDVLMEDEMDDDEDTKAFEKAISSIWRKHRARKRHLGQQLIQSTQRLKRKLDDIFAVAVQGQTKRLRLDEMIRSNNKLASSFDTLARTHTAGLQSIAQSIKRNGQQLRQIQLPSQADSVQTHLEPAIRKLGHNLTQLKHYIDRV